MSQAIAIMAKISGCRQYLGLCRQLNPFSGKQFLRRAIKHAQDFRDHFIYNSNLKNRIKKQAYNENKNDPWNFTLGVLHVENGNSTKIRIGNLKEVAFMDYHQSISDHFPIITEIII